MSDDMEANVQVIESEMEERKMKPFTPIDSVSVVFSSGSSRSSRRILEDLTFDVTKRSPTTIHLFQNILQSIKRFESSGMYKSVDVSLSPGSTKDCVEVEYTMKPASFYFANISHQFDRFGQASMTSKLGFRNVLGYFDKLSFEYNKTLNKSKRSFYNLQWNVPYNFLTGRFEDNFLASLTHSSTILDKACSETKDSACLIYSAIDSESQQERYNITYEAAVRQNYVTATRYRLLEDFLPTKKHSLRLSSTAFSTLSLGSRVHKGASLNYNIEMGIPYLSDVVFVKSESNYKRFMKLKNLKKISQRFRSMNLEFSTNVGIVKSFPFGKDNDGKLTLNECFTMPSIRGISDIEVDLAEVNNNQQRSYGINNTRAAWHDNLNLQVKQSVKLNLYDFPGLQKSGVIPFYHASAGYFYRSRAGTGASQLRNFEKNEVISHMRNHLRASAGIGLSIGIGGSAKAELLYNFWHLAKSAENLSSLELRISVDD